MLAGTTTHCKTNASPRVSSTTNTATLTTMINAVMAGKCCGRRDASDNGTIVPTVVFSAAGCSGKDGPRVSELRASVVPRCSELGKQGVACQKKSKHFPLFV